MRIFYFAPENSGVAYYRFYQPLEELREKGLIELRSWGFDFTEKKLELPTLKELKEITDWADLFIFGRNDVPPWFGIIQTLKEFTKKPILLDIDDNIFAISPYMAARQSYHPNGEAIKIHEQIAKYVDGIVVSTPALEEIYKKYNKTFLIPNGVKYILDKKKHEGVNIGYIATGSHLENAQIIEPALISILRKYSKVRLFYSKSFNGFMDMIPEEIKPQVNYLPWFPLKEYLQRVNNLNLDIGLAPLIDTDFSRCKSNIRVLEYWQNKIAVIASPVGEYKNTITDGYDGILAQDSDWEDAIEDLVKNPEKRNYLIRNSKETLAKYDISHSANKYYEVLREFADG